jgi:hypothetical protein
MMESNHLHLQSKVILAVLGIEPRLKRVSMNIREDFHNVTCYHYTTPPKFYDCDRLVS